MVAHTCIRLIARLEGAPSSSASTVDPTTSLATHSTLSKSTKSENAIKFVMILQVQDSWKHTELVVTLKVIEGDVLDDGGRVIKTI